MLPDSHACVSCKESSNVCLHLSCPSGACDRLLPSQAWPHPKPHSCVADRGTHSRGAHGAAGLSEPLAMQCIFLNAWPCVHVVQSPTHRGRKLARCPPGKAQLDPLSRLDSKTFLHAAGPPPGPTPFRPREGPQTSRSHIRLLVSKPTVWAPGVTHLLRHMDLFKVNMSLRTEPPGDEQSPPALGSPVSGQWGSKHIRSRVLLRGPGALPQNFVCGVYGSGCVSSGACV